MASGSLPLTPDIYRGSDYTSLALAINESLVKVFSSPNSFDCVSIQTFSLIIELKHGTFPGSQVAYHASHLQCKKFLEAKLSQ